MQEVYDRILNDKNAPQGNVQSNLKCALYLVLCLYKINFNDVKSLSLMSYLLSSVGYKGSLLNVTKEQYETLARELVDEGSLVSIEDYSAYSRPSALKEFVAKIRAKKLNTAGVDDFIYYIEDDKGKEFSLDVHLEKTTPHSMVIVTPFLKRRHFYYNQKINNLKVSGHFCFGDF